jgi:hypothetical protein
MGARAHWLVVTLLGSVLALGQANEKVLWRFSGYPDDGAQRSTTSSPIQLETFTEPQS